MRKNYLHLAASDYHYFKERGGFFKDLQSVQTSASSILLIRDWKIVEFDFKENCDKKMNLLKALHIYNFFSSQILTFFT